MVISQFADDSGTWLKGSNMSHLQKRAQAGLDSIWKWAIEWGFKISPTKTVGVLFGDKKTALFGPKFRRQQNYL